MKDLKWGAVLLCLACAVSAGAAERKAYKYVDEKGSVTYSQTPPLNKDAKAVDITPAHQGRGGYTGPYWNASLLDFAADLGTRPDTMLDGQRRREEARKQRLANLEAQCNQSRGTECKNPETLRYLEAQRIPRSGRP